MRILISLYFALLCVNAKAAEKFDVALEQEVTTSHGDLSAERDYEKNNSILRLNGKVILSHEDAPIFMSPLISGKGKEFVLAFLSTGGISCAGEFVVVQLGDPVVLSKPFGNCNEKYTASVEGDSLVISMPSYIPHPELLTKAEIARLKKKVSVYVWNNGKLSVRK